MGRKCIIITSEYPYSHGEPFLDDEILYLSSSFDEVIVYSNYGKKSDKIDRKLPSNVIVYPLGINKKIKLRFIMNGLLKYKHEEKIPKKFINIIFLFYAIGRSFYLFQNIKNNLPMIDKDDGVIIYSYWLNYSCRAGIYLNELLTSKYDLKKSIVISRAHGHDIYSERNKYNFLPLQEFNIKNSKYIFPCSIQGTEYLINRYGHAEKILCSYLGVKKGTHSGNLKSKIFITISWFYPVKRMPLFAEAFSIFSSFVNDWTWVAIGGIGEDFCHVNNIIKKHNLSERVTILGALTHHELLSFYNQNKISYLVNTSSSEGLPVSIMEAQARGIPCIGTDVGGVSEIINGRNGVLIDPNITKEDLAEILINMSQISEKDYSIMSQNSIATWNLKFNSEINYKQWVINLHNALE